MRYQFSRLRLQLGLTYRDAFITGTGNIKATGISRRLGDLGGSPRSLSSIRTGLISMLNPGYTAC